MGKPLFTIEKFISSIPGTGGIISTIARKVGCDWHTAKKYIEAHPKIKLAYNNECEGILDLAEIKLIEQIRDGEGWAIKYMLSTKGKSRGYVERVEQEHSGPGGGELIIKVKYERDNPDDPQAA